VSGPKSIGRAIPLGQLAAAFIATLVFAVPGSDAAAVSKARSVPGLVTGFANAPLLTFASPDLRYRWLGKAARDGAALVRVPFEWREVAPASRPRGFVASNPGSRGYNWGRLDSAMEAITSRGLKPVLMPYLAPDWAQDGKPPSKVRPGAWRPDPRQFGDFAAALARRYSGHFPDPTRRGHLLPRVSYYQAWNEPNLSYDLSPAWRKTRSGWVPESPDVYRPMLNAFYASVKRVHHSNFVLSGGTAPYGDAGPRGKNPKLWRVRPLAFYRTLFCLNRRSKRVACAGPVHLDAVDNHPYVFGPPTARPYYSDDLNIADMWKLGRVLKAGEHAGTVLPGGHPQVWAGELSFASDPPLHTKLGFPPARQARYIEQSMYLLWRQHVSTVSLLQIRDAAPSRSTDPFNYGGLYFYSGAPKPALTAFRFPFITRRINSREIQVWGRAPTGGKLRIERQQGGRWHVVMALHVARRQVVLKTLRARGGANFRAQVGHNTSLVWSQSG
jgi:hypothetical protein